MSGLREPVGGQPPEVYWRRRIVAVIGLVLAFVVLYFLVFSPGGKDDKKETPGASTSPETSQSPNPTSSPAPSGEARACTTADVQLTATANPQNFAAGALPLFDVAIKNSGASPCMLDTAAAGTELKITSGSDRIFSSLDCPADATINARQFLLAAGASDAFSVTWNRQRSAEGCTAVTATPKAGTYHALLTIQGISAGDVTFTLSD